MTFLVPALLWALPIALLPIVVHLLNLRRHKRVDWGAMQFLLQATRQRKGHTRLRHLLILALRVLATAAILLVICRPMAGRWFGWFGGRPETVLIVLDRSASMGQQDLQSGLTKRQAALQQLSTAIRQAGAPRHLVLIESAHARPIELGAPEALAELPEVGGTDGSANLPGLLQTALEYVVSNRAGRTDIWVCSDLQATDWNAENGQWAGVRGGFAELKQPVRFHLLSYAQQDDGNLSVRVQGLERRSAGDGDQLVIDVEVRRARATQQPLTVPLSIVVDGARSVVELEMVGDVAELTDYVLPLDRQRTQGWGKVEVPNDSNPRDNVYFFRYREMSAKNTLVVSDEPGSAWPLRLAAAPPQSQQDAAVQVVGSAEVGTLPLNGFALLLWQAPLPGGEQRAPLERFVAAGGQILFLPAAREGEESFAGQRWGGWQKLAAEPMQSVDKWRDDAGLVAHVESGEPLPVNRLEVRDYCRLEGNGQVLARLHSGDPLLVQVPTERGGIHFLTTLPQDPFSNLAREGIVFFSLIQRALNAGAERLQANQFGEIEPGRTAEVTGKWQLIDGWPEGRLSTEQPFVAGVFQEGDTIVARNRSLGEDLPAVLNSSQLDTLFAGLNYRLVEDSVTQGRSLVTEIWRVFVLLMMLALVGESFLCLPDVRPRKQVAA